MNKTHIMDLVRYNEEGDLLKMSLCHYRARDICLPLTVWEGVLEAYSPLCCKTCIKMYRSFERFPEKREEFLDDFMLKYLAYKHQSGA